MFNSKFYFKIGFLLIAFLFVLDLSYQPTSVLAISSGLQVAPSVKEVTISPNQGQTSFAMHVRNNTQNKVTLLVSIADFGALDETGGVAFLGETGNLKRRHGLAGWASLDKDSITLLPGQSGEVMVTVINRETLALGGHYGAVLFKLAAPPGNDPKKVRLNQVFSSLILLKKSGGEAYSLSLDKIEQVKNIYTLPDSIKLRFYNGGNVHVAPGGSVRLLDPFGREIARGTINPEAGRALPGSFRVFQTQLKRSNAAWIPGRYQVVVNYNFDEQDHFTTYKSSFIFMNGLGIVVAIGLFLALSYVIWRRKQIKDILGEFPFKDRLKSEKQPIQKARLSLDIALACKRSILSILPQRSAQLKNQDKENSKSTKIKINHLE